MPADPSGLAYGPDGHIHGTTTGDGESSDTYTFDADTRAVEILNLSESEDLWVNIENPEAVGPLTEHSIRIPKNSWTTLMSLGQGEVTIKLFSNNPVDFSAHRLVR